MTVIKYIVGQGLTCNLENDQLLCVQNLNRQLYPQIACCILLITIYPLMSNHSNLSVHPYDLNGEAKLTPGMWNNL